MARNVVASVGVVVHKGVGGYYDLYVWHRLEGGGRHHEVVYSDLTWTEMVDVALGELHGRRPGWELGDGWSQPPLFPSLEDDLR